MGVIERQKQDIQKQIILITQAIDYLVTIDDTDLITAGGYIADDGFLEAQSFFIQTSPTKMKPTKINADGVYHFEYEPYCHYGELKAWINDYISSGLISDKLKKLGFAKKRFLLNLQGSGFAISNKDLINSYSPIYDDMDINNDDVTGFAFYETLPKDYNIVVAENQRLREEIEQLKNKKDSSKLPQYGYLDRENKYFSIEMKVAHDTWNYLFVKGNYNHLSHTQKVKNYLSNDYEFKVNDKAISRIISITNPKDKLAKSS